MGSGWGPPLTITQDGKQLVVEQALFSRYDLQPPVKTVYALDGSESRNAVMTGHATQMRVSRARWDGAALVITTTYPAIDPATGKPFTTEVTQRLTLESPGVLVIEATRAGALGGKPTARGRSTERNRSLALRRLVRIGRVRRHVRISRRRRLEVGDEFVHHALRPGIARP